MAEGGKMKRIALYFLFIHLGFSIMSNQRVVWGYPLGLYGILLYSVIGLIFMTIFSVEWILGTFDKETK